MGHLESVCHFVSEKYVHISSHSFGEQFGSVSLRMLILVLPVGKHEACSEERVFRFQIYASAQP